MTTFTDGGLVFSSFTAASDIHASQYKIVQLASTAGQVKLGTSGTSKIIGVLVNDPVSGEPAVVQYGGIAKVLAETSVTAGSCVACSSTGRAKNTTTANDAVLGKALEASSKAGDLIRVIVSLNNY